ncbi:MAG TPA: radical SAM protein [Bacteroidales bacterium]|nr:MAG: radical SAM protein [Bacteroidetes bacterium GWF2_33_38]OFY75958.1 MAG: radical SAM protein [Bacteroidetes bacterium RIFOXYA12_FULL_33_9]OFY86267.1 MAG: radical SAM protein [Bacteroidetes bacterium RIFOXYA2_FULL_33_7]HBF88219.1 radical SAM protein [Bacteroidales bacterium]
MFDRFNRKINYLRISVTDRCNLRCQYCMPAEGVKMLSHQDILSFDEILEVIKVAVNLGLEKVRITGGEPLVRKGIVDLLAMISNVAGIKDLSMTSNGIFLDKYADDLRKAGLQRINISLDTINPIKYKEITRGGDIQKVFDGIKAAKNAGLYPIKINTVILNSRKEKDAIEVEEFCRENDLQIRFIHLMNLEKGEYTVVEGGEGGNCIACNRLRLTSNGLIKPCLFSDIAYSVRELGAENAILKAIENKPQCGTTNTKSNFYNIGG